jgi:hypothetical protein
MRAPRSIRVMCASARRDAVLEEEPSGSLLQPSRTRTGAARRQELISGTGPSSSLAELSIAIVELESRLSARQTPAAEPGSVRTEMEGRQREM